MSEYTAAEFARKIQQNKGLSGRDREEAIHQYVKMRRKEIAVDPAAMSRIKKSRMKHKRRR